MTVEDTPTEVVIADEVNDAPEEVTVEGDTTVVVDAAPAEPTNDATDAVVVETALSHEGRITALELRMSEVEGRAMMAEFAAEDALNQTEQLAAADAAIVEAADAAIVETVENAEIEDVDNDGDEEIVVDEVAPVSARVHPLFRTFADWRAGRK